MFLLWCDWKGKNFYKDKGWMHKFWIQNRRRPKFIKIVINHENCYKNA